MRTPLVDVALRLACMVVVAWTFGALTWALTRPVSGPIPQVASAAERLAVVRATPAARGLLSLAAAPAQELTANAVTVVVTPAGEIEYTAALDVVATYYTPANGGKVAGSRWYGITATGARATRGIVAVDPRVIPMYAWLYVPGYGVAQARDVGSAIIGDHIDVAFDDGDGAWWGRRYLTVYILAR